MDWDHRGHKFCVRSFTITQGHEGAVESSSSSCQNTFVLSRWKLDNLVITTGYPKQISCKMRLAITRTPL